MKFLFTLVVLVVFAYAQSENDPCVPREQCSKDTLWTGPLCAYVDGKVRNFVDKCDITFAECMAREEFERIETRFCNFPADYGVNPEWFKVHNVVRGRLLA